MSLLRRLSEDPGLLRQVLTRNYVRISADDETLGKGEFFPETEEEALRSPLSTSCVVTPVLDNDSDSCSRIFHNCNNNSDLSEEESNDNSAIPPTENSANTSLGGSPNNPDNRFSNRNSETQTQTCVSQPSTSVVNIQPSTPVQPCDYLSPLPVADNRYISPLFHSHGFSPASWNNDCLTTRNRSGLKSNLFAQGQRSPRDRLASRGSPRLVRKTDLIFGDLIGKGTFGSVHEGTLSGRPVAIKIVYKRRGSGVHREIVQAERLAHTLCLRHKNIVSVLAVNVSDGPRGDALIIMELVQPCTLQALLDDVTKVISTQERLQFALEISQALHYLHSNHVAHLDVKPKNVLMTSSGTCKLADFGNLTRTRPDDPREEFEFTQLLGTLPYRAPELMKGAPPSAKADVFSLAITLWQMVTRRTPYEGFGPHQLIYLVVKQGKRPEPHDTGNDPCQVMYRDLYVACWNPEPKSRPPAQDIVTSISTMMT
ncbi:serine/threonine-protein kinase mos [Aplysia californica]|uniref:non-specific serine/threonine protein kinase n=1 Tax=Aplysia californica TaxID=6500 RepID=A0ABM0JKP9_APLCA|nr:serine/threonine-protein kinase mos [Aplysia californica]XP_035825005.1 serine/threonine-protein kinase mos [Aplysia californica]XP_035825006.1 serine/threonine-protein kinase mos [Aplysia californica]